MPCLHFCYCNFIEMPDKISQAWWSDPSARQVRVGNPNVDAILVEPGTERAATVHCAHIWFPSVTPTNTKDIAISFARAPKAHATKTQGTAYLWLLMPSPHGRTLLHSTALPARRAIS